MDFFDHIYVINLESSAERKEGMIKEFSRIGLTEDQYEIFTACNKDSPEVKKIYDSNLVQMYPPCFRCGQTAKERKCGCSNNVLIGQQIANWCSFINVFKDIKKNEYKRALICEDDLRFFDNHNEILETLFNSENFEKYRIDEEKPLLIRLEQRGPQPRCEIKFNKDAPMSNACFMINHQFARLFIAKRSKIIKDTSDIYIHTKFTREHRNIQHFTAIPSPTYQLSHNKMKNIQRIYSDIHPAGIDDYDKERLKNHLMRIEHGELLIIGQCMTTCKKIKDLLLYFGVNVQPLLYEGGGPEMFLNCYSWKNKDIINKYYFDNILYVMPGDKNGVINSLSTEKNEFIRNIMIEIIQLVLDVDLSKIEDDKKLSTEVYNKWHQICEEKATIGWRY